MKTNKIPPNYQRIIDDAWLGIDVEPSTLFNPLEHIPSAYQDEPHLYVLWLMQRPEYFSFICKELFGVQLLPVQAILLQEMWLRRFPMLIACRGFGKATGLDELIQTPSGWVKMRDISVGDTVYNRDGKPCKVTHIHPQGKKQVCKVTLLDGRSIECCEDHLWVVKNQKKETVVDTKTIIESGVKYKKSKNGGCVYKYKIPNCSPIEFDKKDLPVDPYLLGCLLGDGCLTTLTPKIASDDIFIIDQFRDKLDGFELKKDSTNNNYTIVDRNKIYSDYISTNGNKYKQRSRNRLTTIIREIGLNVKCDKKFIPENYKYSSIEDRMELVRGLMDSDGSINSNGAMEFTNTCEQLVDDLVEVLRSLGITCVKTIDDRSGQNMVLPQGTNFERRPYFRVFINTSLPIFKLPRKLDRIKNKSTNGEKYVSIVNAQYLDKYIDMQCITVDSPDHTYITTDHIVTHNSFMLALYALLRITLLPERTVIICGAAFRQSKVIFNYMESIWYNAPMLRDFCGAGSGPRHAPDMFSFNIGSSSALAIPIGDGCVSPYTQTTYDDCFGRMDRFGNYSHYRPIRIWGNNKFNTSDYYFSNGVKDVKKLVTNCGYTFEGTDNHKIKVIEDHEVKWKRLDEIQSGDKVLIDRSVRWHNGNFKCSNDQAYSLGAMIGDGCWTKESVLRFATEDLEITDLLGKGIGVFRQCSDKVHFEYRGVGAEDWLNFWKLKPQCYTKDKQLPSTILSAPKEQMSACLRGLFDTDGHVCTDTASGGIAVLANFTNTSKVLVEQIQYILLHYGIVSTLRYRDRNDKWNRVYELGIYGKNVQIFSDQIGFGLKRKQNILEQALQARVKKQSISDNIPNIKSLMLYICKHFKASGFPEVCYSKIEQRTNISFNLVAKFLLKYKDVTHPYIEIIRNLADLNVYYDTVKNIEDNGQIDTYDLHVPDTHEYCANGFYSHNSRIRGQRANDIIADEFAAQSKEVFENVIAGFASVRSSPVESVKARASRFWSEKFGFDFEDSDKLSVDNQIVLSGTAYYDFNHFGEYWKRWRSIIRSKGDTSKLEHIFGQDGIPEDFSWKDYSIFRLPYELVPKGFMDEAMVARSKATIHTGIYLMEFAAVFSNDSNGFFKRTLIESCVISNNNEIALPSGRVEFTSSLQGRSDRQYIYGIDPASEVDNFSIIILEHHMDHRRIVYAWSTNRKEHKERVNKGLAQETDFYSYCAKKIRELMRVFPCARIAMDSQGGGIAVGEALHDFDKIDVDEGEVPIWPIIDPEKPRPDTDGEPGLHIIEMINFSSADWTSEANHGLRKDFEDKACIFPFFDSVSLGLAKIADENGDRLYDTLEDCLMEIEELKNELSTIVITQTATGRDKWDTPEVKLPGNKKGRLRKDRYSALLMANMVSRQMARNPAKYFKTTTGGWAGSSKASGEKNAYVGAAWLARGLEGIYD